MREIVRYPNPILRKKSEEVREITEEIKKLTQDLKEIMLVNQGIGLAAPQVGILKRIIVVQFSQKPQVFFNPKIIKKSRETLIEEEGCLSFPGLFLKIKRAKEVEVEFLNENGEKIRIKTEGLLARIFQHEIDHLNGILLIDHVRVWRKIWELLKFYIKSKKK